ERLFAGLVLDHPKGLVRRMRRRVAVDGAPEPPLAIAEKPSIVAMTEDVLGEEERVVREPVLAADVLGPHTAPSATWPSAAWRAAGAWPASDTRRMTMRWKYVCGRCCAKLRSSATIRRGRSRNCRR